MALDCQCTITISITHNIIIKVHRIKMHLLKDYMHYKMQLSY